MTQESPGQAEGSSGHILSLRPWLGPSPRSPLPYHNTLGLPAVGKNGSLSYFFLA